MPPRKATGTNTAPAQAPIAAAAPETRAWPRWRPRGGCIFSSHIRALDVLEHHDGVVHHDADRQRRREQGEGVDREAEPPQAGEGADRRYRHGDQRDHVARQLEEAKTTTATSRMASPRVRTTSSMKVLADFDVGRVVDAGDPAAPRRSCGARCAPGCGRWRRIAGRCRRRPPACRRGGAGVVTRAPSSTRAASFTPERARRPAARRRSCRTSWGSFSAPLAVTVHRLLAGGSGLLADLAGGVLAVLGADGVGNIGGRRPAGPCGRASATGGWSSRGRRRSGRHPRGMRLRSSSTFDQRVVGEEQRCPAGIRRGQGGDHPDLDRSALHRHAELAHHMRQARFGDLDAVVKR